MEVQNSIIEIKNIIREIVSPIEPLAAKRGNRLIVKLETELTYISVDSMKLKQILLNLLGNACKFTDSGDITLRIYDEISSKNAQRYLIFKVSDTGIGIRPETLKKLFQPFTQEEQNYVRRYSGTGLGLSICKRLIELMGGNINVSTQAGKGSHFLVHLPIDIEQNLLIQKFQQLDQASNG